MNARTHTWLSLLASCLMAAFLLAHAPAALAAPSFQAAGTPVNGTGSVTPAWPTHAVDDIALLIVESRGDEPVTLSTAAGFVAVTNSPQVAGTDTQLTVFWARATSTAMASPTVADPGNHVFAQIVTYRNVTPDAGDPWDVTGGGAKTTASTSVTVTGVTTTVNDALIVQIVSRASDRNGADFSGQANASLTSLTERYDDGTNNGDGGGFVVWDGVLATAGATGNTTATIGNSTTNAFLTIALKPLEGPTPPPGGSYGATQCAGDRFGSNLVCTANDVQITSLTAVGSPGYCTAGDNVSMTFDVTVNSATPDRWDIGIFFSNDGKDPQPTPANGGANSCTVTVLPTTAPFLNLDPGPHSGQSDLCGDVNGSMNPTLIGGVASANQGIHRVENVTVKCQSKSGSNGNLWVPFVLSWDNQSSPSGSLCQSNLDPVPNTKSKCNAPTVAQATVVGVIVLPKIEKSDGITVIDNGQTTNYSVVITNNTGDTISSATFTDPAIANLTVNSVTCAASGGATCPATGTNPGELSVANMQGAGVTITSMPAGSALTFSVNATASGTVAYGTLITNTASVTTNGQTNSATDTNTVGSTALDHYELALAASSVACEANAVTVTACASAATTSPCTNVYTGADVNGQTSTLATTAGTLASTTPTFTTGVGSTTLSYTSAVNGSTATVSLNSVPVTAPSATLCCQGGTCTTGSSCTTTFYRDALFIADTDGGGVANIPHQTAGIKSGQFYVRAVKTLGDGSCDNALRGSANIDFAYECNNPATCYSTNNMKIETVPTTTITNNNSGSVGASSGTYTSVPMTFSNAGYAPFYLTYEDVGLVTLHTKYTTGSLYGASNAFVVKPYRFLLSNILCTGSACAGNTDKSNPAAADETGTAFVKAGSPFSVTVTAVAANISNATPAYGRESPAETVKLTPTLVAPLASVGGVNPAIENATAFGAFSSGTATGTTFAWSEVGIITLTPSVGDGNYLAAGDVSGNTSGNVGRFIPHHFKVTDTPGCGGSSFTYSGQAFTATSTAQALGNTTTQNYRGTSPVFARNTSFTDADLTYTATCTNSNMLAANYSAGVGTLSGIVCSFLPVKESPPGITLRAKEDDIGGDGVTSQDGSAGNGDDSMDLRSGRVRLFNANGSELLHLAVPMRVEYYVDTTITSPATTPSTAGWIVNAADTCSAVTLKAPTNCKRQLDACQADPALRETCVQDSGNPGVSGQGCTVTGSWELYTSLPTGGSYSLWLKAPGAGNYGSVDLAANLSSSMPWLQYDWDGDGNHTNDPVGTATFGTYRGNPRHIHIREIY